MAEVSVERTTELSRDEASAWLSALSEAFGRGDRMDIELELSWSLAKAKAKATATTGRD
jgi:hypothetical protein